MAENVNRERLPDRRHSDLATIEHEGIRYTVQWSRFPDGRLAELFIDAGKPGHAIDIMSKDLAVLLSIALQSGVSPALIKEALSQEIGGRMRGPLGVILDLIQNDPAGTITVSSGSQ